MRTTGFMKTRLLAVALGAVCISLLFGFHSNATAAGSGDPRITILQGQVRALQAQVKLLQTRDKTFSKELASTEDQVELSFSSQTCLAAHVADLFEGTWGVIDQIKPTFGPQTQLTDFGNCNHLGAGQGRPSVPRGPVTVPPNMTEVVPLIAWLHE